jgi:hypothetical protein
MVGMLLWYLGILVVFRAGIDLIIGKCVGVELDVEK